MQPGADPNTKWPELPKKKLQVKKYSKKIHVGQQLGADPNGRIVLQVKKY